MTKQIKKLVYKYKDILLALLVLLSLVYFFTPIVEGFDFSLPSSSSFSSSSSSTKPIGMYEYLSPPYPMDNERVMIQKYTESVSDDLMKRLVDKWNTINCPENRDKTKNACNPLNTVGQGKLFFSWYGTPSVPEINYYIDNGKWPYNQFVLDYAKNNPDLLKNLPKDPVDGRDYTIDKLMKISPVRGFFGWFMKDKIMLDNNADPGKWNEDSDSIPLPVRIYSGKAVAPKSSGSSFSSNSSSNTSNLSDSDYKNLVSLCKTVAKNN